MGKAAASGGVEVDRPGGGKLILQTAEEAELWEQTANRMTTDYSLQKTNDLNLLSALLTQTLAMFRAQQAINGMEAETDAAGAPTGRYIHTKVSIKDQAAANNLVLAASSEIRQIEKALGIDKKTRDAGGGDSIAGYLGSLKIAGRQLGIHIVKRVKAYEEFCMELRWRVRVLDHGDDEDKAHHGISEKSIIDFARTRMIELEEIDKNFAKTKGKLFAGKL